MKKRKDNIVFYVFIIAISFVMFIMIITSDVRNTSFNVANINRNGLRNIFSINAYRDLEDMIPHLSLSIEDGGYDIYVPSGKGYRYGPSIIYYDDGSIDTWFASNGNNSTEWDYITYRHYDGENWSNERIVLRPTVNGKDHYSTCDPGVIYFGGYYYLGYTSTENATKGGVENCCYVARSKNPDGPYEKWNGNGWGGSPEPFIVYDENDLGWGAGEISFVVVNDKLYCYYTWIDGSDSSYTKLAITSLKEDWPSTLNDKGIVITKTNGQGSFDFVYAPQQEKFLAVSIQGSFGANSEIAVYESYDGINFNHIDTVDNVEKFAHNIGISKRENGHVLNNDELIIGYGYSKANVSTWGRWACKFEKAKLKIIYFDN